MFIVIMQAPMALPQFSGCNRLLLVRKGLCELVRVAILRMTAALSGFPKLACPNSDSSPAPRPSSDPVFFLGDKLTIGFGLASVLMARGVWLHLTEHHEHEQS